MILSSAPSTILPVFNDILHNISWVFMWNMNVGSLDSGIVPA